MSPELVQLQQYIDRLELYIAGLVALAVIAALATAYVCFSRKDEKELPHFTVYFADQAPTSKDIKRGQQLAKEHGWEE